MIPSATLLGVKMHLAAIFQLMLLLAMTGVRDSLGLGRYYLRLSWLYRELEEHPEFRDDAQQVRALLAGLRQDWPQVPSDAVAAASRAAKEYENAISQSTALESPGEACDLMLLVARIYIKLGRHDAARQVWGKASQLARSVEASKRSLEEQYSKMQDQAHSSAKSIAEAAKEAMPEISKQIVETDALGRSLRNKTQEVRNLIHDLADSQPPSPGNQPTSADKPKKKLFGLFK